MIFEILLTFEAQKQLSILRDDPSKSKRLKAVMKSLRLLSGNPRHPSLQTHEYTSLQGPRGEKVFEAYAEQNTPAAYRVFWFYGPGNSEITVITITPHP